MNRVLVFAGIAVVAISKIIVLKSIIVDSLVYQRCVADESASVAQAVCGGTDLFVYFIIGWFITVGGFILLVFGLKMLATRRNISR